MEVAGWGRRQDGVGADEAGAVRMMCSFRVGGGLYGVRIAKVREILGPTRPWDVPLAPVFVGGLVHYRGEILTTVSLRVLLNLPTLKGCGSVLVVDCASGCYGLLVDEVVEMVEVESCCFEEIPATAKEGRKRLFCGVYKRTDGLLIEMDPERLDPLRLEMDAAADGLGALPVRVV